MITRSRLGNRVVVLFWMISQISEATIKDLEGEV